MNNQNEEQQQKSNVELLKEQSSACGPGCACNTSEPLVRIRWVVGVIILCAAAALVVRAIAKNKDSAADKTTSDGFAALTAPGQMLASYGVTATSNTVAIKEIEALSDLNTLATDMAGVFVFVSGKDEATDKVPTKQILGAAKTIEPQAGGKIGSFSLKTGSRDYDQIAAQMAVPGVLAMVRGRGMAPVSGEITETKLVQAFVAASNSGGCGAGGCGPSGCK